MMSSIKIGALAPLSLPGWAEAGLQLLAGLRLGVNDLNDAGGIAGRPIELVVRDTKGDPGVAIAAVDDLAEQGVVAVAGEYHSVVAQAVAARCDVLNVPFLCSSAVIDRLVDSPTDWVARLAPPQSRGWSIYADYLLDAGHRRIAVAAQPGAYWLAGTNILRACFSARGGSVVAFDAHPQSAMEICDHLAAGSATALLLLAGIPEPAVSIVRAVRHDRRCGDVLIGTPAGQAELPQWMDMLGAAGAQVPFLRYLPSTLGSVGRQAEVSLQTQLGRSPSFVAYEGYDAILALATALQHHLRGTPIAECWSSTAVTGTRGTIDFMRSADSGVWQWPRPPIQVVARDRDDWATFHVLKVDDNGPGEHHQGVLQQATGAHPLREQTEFRYRHP